MAVFREIELLWEGKRHVMVPSVSLLRRVKGRGINNLTLAREVMYGGADPSELAVVHQMFMAEAGVSVSEEDSYGFLTGGDTAEVVAFQTAYVNAVVPSIDLGKKQEAPAQEPQAPAAPKAKRNRKPRT